MKNLNLLLALFISFTFSAQTIFATTYHVIPGKTGNGLSWENASGDLAAVLFAAKYGDEIWVAGGTYFPTRDNNRKVSFVINNGVKVYGGFNGTETKLSQRNSKNNPTILSGAIGEATNQDNSFTVIYTKNTDSNTVLDGFIITGGCSNQGGASGTPQKCGGGMFNDGQGETGKADILVSNCIFKDNYGRDGGAVYNNGNGGNANPTFKNCQFINNSADLDGGAIFNDGRLNGNSSPEFTACKFENNIGGYGGAMLNYGAEGNSQPIVTNCQFENNESYTDGPCFFNVALKGNAQETVVDCQFMNQELSTKENQNSNRTKNAVLTSYKTK